MCVLYIFIIYTYTLWISIDMEKELFFTTLDSMHYCPDGLGRLLGYVMWFLYIIKFITCLPFGLGMFLLTLWIWLLRRIWKINELVVNSPYFVCCYLYFSLILLKSK